MPLPMLANATRTAAQALAVSALLASAAAAQSGETRLRIVGGLAGVNQFTQHEEPFWTTELPRLSGGKLTAEIVPFDRAGIRAAETLRLLQLGTVPFATMLVSHAGPQDMVLAAPDLAGLAPDMAALRKVVGAYRPHMEKTLRENYGVELLGIYTYPAQVLFCSKPLAGLGDLKGRRVRTSSPSQSDMVEALGGEPVRTAFAEILANVQSGNIDCVVTGTMSGNTIGLHEATTHIHAMAVNWGLSLFAANAGAWQALSVEHRKLLKRELGRVESQIWESAERETGAGIACNTGAASCTHGKKGTMTEVRGSAADEKRRREIFASTVLARWVQRCGAPCAQVWNQTLASTAGIKADAGAMQAAAR